MSQNQKFEQIWEFRRRDDDIDSSSDDSKSNSDGEKQIRKKHNLVPNSVLPENDDISDSPRSLNVGKANPEYNGLERGKGSIKSKANRVSGKKKSKRISEMTISDDFRIFTNTILEDLRVARENMFARMRQEMDELVNLKSSSGPKQKRGPRAQKADRKLRARKTNQTQPKKSTADFGSKAQNCNGEFPETPAVKDTQTEASNGYKVSEERANLDLAAAEMARPLVKTPVFPDQIVSSSYLTLPFVQSDGYNFERGNLKINGGGANHYFSGIQAEEPFSKSFERSKNMGCYEQQHGLEPSSMGTGFPVLLQQRLDNSFGIPSQVVPESSSRDSNMIGLRLNGGAIRYDHLPPNNNFRSLYPN